MKVILTALLSMMLAFAYANGDDLQQLERSFLDRCDQAQVLRDNKLDKLKDSYSAALSRLIHKLKETGDLDAVLPYSEELKVIESAGDSLPPLSDSADAQLRRMRAQYEDARLKIQTHHAQRITDLSGKMMMALATRESSLTKAGRIDDALATRKLREALEKDQELIDAKALVKSASNLGLGRPGMRIRRSGDNLEVLVHLDRSGKVSLSSPVSNVKEATEPGRTLGDTTATTLGEFIGAKGYEPDTHVAYHEVFDRKEIKGMSLTEIDAESRFAIDEQRGLKLSFKDRASNPHASFGPILPTTNTMGGFRITTRYFIPKTNKKLTGFMFVQPGAGPVGGKKIEEGGEWKVSIIEADASHDNPTLLFYLCAQNGSRVADVPLSDFMVLGEIKIEHTRFSAWVVNRYDLQGNPGKPVTAPESQALVVRMGELIDLP